MALTTRRQLFSVCHMFARRVLYWMLGAGIASGIVVVVGAEHLHTTSLPYVMIPVLFGIVALAVWMTVPHVRRAWQAVRAPQRCEAVTIEIEIDSDPEATRYYVRVHATTSGAWRFEFTPQGWKPAAGSFEAEARYLADVRWPVLVLAPAGLLVPMYEPKRIAVPVSRADERGSACTTPP